MNSPIFQPKCQDPVNKMLFCCTLLPLFYVFLAKNSCCHKWGFFCLLFLVYLLSSPFKRSDFATDVSKLMHFLFLPTSPQALLTHSIPLSSSNSLSSGLVSWIYPSSAFDMCFIFLKAQSPILRNALQHPLGGAMQSLISCLLLQIEWFALFPLRIIVAFVHFTRAHLFYTRLEEHSNN